jgi:predicted MPP superfamily phosphohydrolase
MKISRVVVALLILATVTWSTHRYIWARLVRDPAWPAPWFKVLTVVIVALAGLLPLTFLAMRYAPRWINVPLSWVIYSWMGLVLYLFLLTVLSDAGRGIAALLGQLPTEPVRRQALARAIAAGVSGVSVLLGLGGMINVARGFDIRRIRIPLARLATNASGYVIVQMTDVHVGPTIGDTFLSEVVRETNALSPDMVVITGDLVDGTVEQLRKLVEPLRGLVARDGVFFVTGNHEYYSGADEWIAHLTSMGIRVLRNERVDIRGLFELAGVDDASSAGMLPGHGQDVGRAAAGRSPSVPLVLLAHQPKAVKHAAAANVDLQLSGHVHGGQMIPFNWLARLDQPFIAGLHLVERTWLYVSTGTGYWGPPMRVGSVAELTRIELVAGGLAASSTGGASETRSGALRSTTPLAEMGGSVISTSSAPPRSFV